MGAQSLNTHAIFWAAMLVVAHAHSAGGSEQGPDCKLGAASGKEASGGEHYGCLLRQGLQMKFHGNGNETLKMAGNAVVSILRFSPRLIPPKDV